MARVIGVDACRKGWIGITDDQRGYFGPTIDELIAAAEADGRLEVVAIDIPIGLPTAGPRQADVLARRLVGRRASSVFATPVRAALLATSHGEASALNRAATGHGLSQQAYALRGKILEVDAWVRGAHRVVIEVHPEACFAAMAGGPLAHPKTTWAGVEQRRRILEDNQILLPADLGVAGAMAAVDDVLDAAAACWTAGRRSRGRAVAHPAVPERVADGPTAAIWT